MKLFFIPQYYQYYSFICSPIIIARNCWVMGIQQCTRQATHWPLCGACSRTVGDGKETDNKRGKQRTVFSDRKDNKTKLCNRASPRTVTVLDWVVMDFLRFCGELEGLPIPLGLGKCPYAMHNLHRRTQHPVPQAGVCGNQKVTPCFPAWAEDSQVGTDRPSSGSTLRE